jgi:hypothetical protein
MSPGLDYWHRFKKEFVSAMEREPAKLASAWHGPISARTSYYRATVLPPIAIAFGMDLDPELFRRDYAMRLTAKNGCKAPVVFIESENAGESADYEVEKLCAVSAPLRVLITAMKWEDAGYHLEPGGYRTDCMLKWGKIIQAHHEIWPQPGTLGVIVAEWRTKQKPKPKRSYVKYHGFAFDMAGNVCDPESPLFEQNMSWQALPPGMEDADSA